MKTLVQELWIILDILHVDKNGGWLFTFAQIWRVADVPKGDKYQYTHFAHTINSFDSAPPTLLASDSRLRPDRYALERGDVSSAGFEKSRYFSHYHPVAG